MPKESNKRHRSSQHPYSPASRNKPTDLLFFFELKTSGYNIWKNDIITEMAAKVAYKGDMKELTFLGLVQPSHSIFLSDEEIIDGKSFPEVFKDFFNWMISTSQKLSLIDNIEYRPVMVAHKGFNFHYTILLAEFERHKMDTSFFEQNQVYFADTLNHLRLIRRRDKENTLNIPKKISLENLWDHYFKEREKYFVTIERSQYESLRRAKTLETVFLETELKTTLSAIDKKSFKELNKDFEMKKTVKKAVKELKVAYPPIKDAQARRLVTLNLTPTVLLEIYNERTSDQEFEEKLRKRKVNSAPLRKNLLEWMADADKHVITNKMNVPEVDDFWD